MKKFFSLSFLFIAILLVQFSSAFAADTTAPAVPRGVDAAGGSTAYEMVVTWTNPADSDLDHINLYLSTTGGYSSPNVWATVAAQPNTKGAYRISNLSSGATYYLYLAAVDTSSNKSAYTTELKRTTATSPDTTSPAAATNFIAKDLATDGAITLSWTNPADDDFFQVRIYRDITSDFTPGITNQVALIFGLPSGASSYNDSALTNGTTYYYKIRTEDNRGNLQTGLFYPSASATPSKAPLVASAVTSFSPASGATGTHVTIQGMRFTKSGNDVHFGVGGIKNVSSSDGVSLIFSVPSQVSGCDFVTASTVCDQFVQEVTPGVYSVYVQNANGQSNSETFTVTAAPTASARLGDLQGKAILDGDTIKTSDSPDIYIVNFVGDKKFRRLILNPEVFNSYGQLSWSAIKTVSQDVMNDLTVSTLVIEANPDGSVANPKVYSLTSDANSDVGVKHWLNMTPVQFQAAGYDWDSIYHVNHNEVGIYLQGSDIVGS